MSTHEGEEKVKTEFTDKNKLQGNDFRLGFAPFDPLHVVIALIYGLTRWISKLRNDHKDQVLKLISEFWNGSSELRDFGRSCG